MKKLTVTFALVLTLTLLLSLSVYAAPDQDAAQYLYDLGLLRGTGTDQSGNPIFELERAPTRIEALVMLLRLTGCDLPDYVPETPHPFTDIPVWAKHYADYAYDNGITKGVSATSFGSADTATAGMYVTFMLRALGYSDTGENPDFSYAGAVEYGQALGLMDGVDLSTAFTRGDVALVSKNALSLPLSDGSQTLYSLLTSKGVIASGWSFSQDGTALTVGIQSEAKNWYYIHTLDCATLKAALPGAAGFLVSTSTDNVSESLKYTKDEMIFLEALSRGQLMALDTRQIVSYNGYCIYVIDASYSVLAWTYLPDEVIEEITFTVGNGIDGAKLYADYRKVIDTIDENWGKNQFQLDDGRYAGWDDSGGMTYSRPLLMNGEYIDDGWYAASFYGDDIAGEENLMGNIENGMFMVFFQSDCSIRFDDDRPPQNYYLSEEFGDVWLIPSGGGAPVSRGLRVREHGPELLVIIFTPDGEYLGHLVIPQR